MTKKMQTIFVVCASLLFGFGLCLNLCGDWFQYKDIKCIKSLGLKGTESKAFEKCTEVDPESILLTIQSQDEQNTMEQLLNIGSLSSSNHWIGLKKVNNEYQWIDEGLPLSYVNWARHATQVATCVQMSATGMWRDVRCDTTAMIVCQKRQDFNLEIVRQLIEAMGKTIENQQQVIDKQLAEIESFRKDNETQQRQLESLENSYQIQQNMIESLKMYNESQRKQIESLKKDNETQQRQFEILHNSQIMIEIECKNKSEIQRLQYLEISSRYVEFEELNLEDKDLKSIIHKSFQPLFPIGFIYTQFPNQKKPDELWKNIIWTEVTQEYSGLFFRAEGNGSEPFGVFQHADQSRISNIEVSADFQTVWIDENYDFTQYTEVNRSILEPGKWSHMYNVYNSKHLNCRRFFSDLSFYTTGGEFRPKNKAIKIWKRTG